MCQIINLTPHEVNLMRADGGELRIPPSGVVARVREYTTSRGVVYSNGVPVPVFARQFGEVVDLPEPRDGTLYLVSALVAQAAWAAGRRDVVCPGELIRDAEGRVIGAYGLSVAP